MNRKYLAGICVLVFPWFSGLVEADCVRQATANCTVNSGIQTCSATLMCSGGGTPDAKSRPEVAARWSLRKTGSQNVIACSPASSSHHFSPTATFTLSAMAATAGTAFRECNWQWYSNGSISVAVEAGSAMKTRSRIQATMGTVVIDNSDGLPVELMEFSVGGGSE